MAKRRWMLFCFYLPGVLAGIRIALTIWIFVSNPMGLPFRYFQIIPIGVFCVSLFSYFKLYRDGVPVVTLVAPTMLHFILLFLFKKKLFLIPFIPTFVLDILYLISKGLKANLFPFVVEGETDEEDFEDLDEIFSNAE